MPNKFNPADYPQLRTEITIMKEHEGRVKLFPVGSFETSTADDYNDIDILCLYPADRRLDMFYRFLQDGDWVRDDRNYQDQVFSSFRGLFNDQQFNLLVTNDEDFCSRFLKAATLCKHLNLGDKDHRILVHEMFKNSQLAKNIWEIEV